MAPPTACNRSAGPAVNPSRSAPGMSSTPSAQSHIRGYRILIFFSLNLELCDTDIYRNSIDCARLKIHKCGVVFAYR